MVTASTHPTGVILGLVPRTMVSQVREAIWLDAAALQTHPTERDALERLDPRTKSEDDTKLEARPCSPLSSRASAGRGDCRRPRDAPSCAACDPGPPEVPAAANPSSQQNYGAAACCRFTSSRTATCNLESRARVAASACL